MNATNLAVQRTEIDSDYSHILKVRGYSGGEGGIVNRARGLCARQSRFEFFEAF